MSHKIKCHLRKKNYKEGGVVDLDGREIRVMLERVFKWYIHIQDG